MCMCHLDPWLTFHRFIWTEIYGEITLFPNTQIVPEKFIRTKNSNMYKLH